MDDQRKAAERICKTLTDEGHRALFAGGCVRDLILERQPKDFDIATSAHPEEVEALFDKCISVGAAFGVQMVMLPEGKFEVATFRSDGPYLDGRRPSHVEFRDEKQDALRRDFTINGMFFDPTTGEVVDYVGGQEDLRNQIVRAVGNPKKRFQEDHLRLLRAVRFSARLGFGIEEDTKAAIIESAHLITKTSPERIRDELVKMLTEARPRLSMELLDASGILRHILPEVANMKGVEQPPEYHPEGDVFVHTLLALDRLEKPTATLSLGTLLHDIGKPSTQTFEDRIRFNNHDKVGARMSREICERLQMSKQSTERICWLVGQHMRMRATPDMRESKVKRLIREEGFEELLELFRVDCQASHKKMDVYEWLRDYAANLPPEERRPKPLINGDDLIKLGYAQGKVFAEILDAVEDARLEGTLMDRDSALKFVRESWPPPEGEGQA